MLHIKVSGRDIPKINPKLVSSVFGYGIDPPLTTNYENIIDMFAIVPELNIFAILWNWFPAPVVSDFWFVESVPYIVVVFNVAIELTVTTPILLLLFNGPTNVRRRLL